MAETKNWAIALIILTTALTSFAQIFYKSGVNNPVFSKLFFIFIGAGIASYCLGAVMMIIAFKGGEVTVLYPIFASSYIWVTLLSNFFFGEVITMLKVIGIFVIIAGITLISVGSKKDSVIKYEEVA